MGVVPGPEKMNNTCGKTIYTQMMDRGFIVVYFPLKLVKHKMKLVNPSFTSLALFSMYVTK
jgi:hypothetical protein